MTVEPQNAYTVLRRPLLPPKPAPRVLQPSLSMAEEAKLINRRVRKAWGIHTPEQSTMESNFRKHLEAQERHAKLGEAILTLMAEHPRHKSDLAKLLRVSDQAVRNAFAMLNKQGKVRGWRGAGGLYYWGLA